VNRRRLLLTSPAAAGAMFLDGRIWRTLGASQARSMLLRHSDALTEARVIAVDRRSPSRELCAVGSTAHPQPLGQLAASLGWPDVTGQRAWPKTVADALAARSNDYGVVDLTAAILGLGSLSTSLMKPPPFAGGISVILPARGVADVLTDTLHGIANSARQLPLQTPWECVVVDDANVPPLRLPQGIPPEIRLVRSDTRLYAGGSRNAGLSRARHQLLLFCDSDTVVEPEYLPQHLARHMLASTILTVSLREYVPLGATLPKRKAMTAHDTRVEATYEPGRLGLVPVTERIKVRPLEETDKFREFGEGRLLGPVDLPFMVKGSNIVVSRRLIHRFGFPPGFVGWGPEDVCFAAACIARGAFVIPVLSVGVFHREHPPRSGTLARRDGELESNLNVYRHLLSGSPRRPWESPISRRD
jgi:glycosyltransferase involved in cell wall biosynthesis